MSVLQCLYARVTIRGFIIIDDWGWGTKIVPPGGPCQLAVRDFRSAHGLVEEVVKIKGVAPWWQKMENCPNYHTTRDNALAPRGCLQFPGE